MNCERAQRQASMLLDEDAGSFPGPALDAHLRECEACRRFLDVSVRAADGYRDEVRSRIDALKRLERPRRRPPLALAAALLLAAILGGLVAERPTREAPLKAVPALATASLPAPSMPARRSVLLFEDTALPRSLDSEKTLAPALETDAPLSEWMRSLPVRLAEDLPTPTLPPLPALFSEEL
jgi:hypothetical protein